MPVQQEVAADGEDPDLYGSVPRILLSNVETEVYGGKSPRAPAFVNL